MRRLGAYKLLLWLFTFATLSSCGQDPDSEVTTLATVGPFIPESQVASHIRSAGFPERLVNTLLNIAYCESTFGAGSYNWSGGRRHSGLFQISDLHKGACGYANTTMEGFWHHMADPLSNTKCAYIVYKNAGYSLHPWDCY